MARPRSTTDEEILAAARACFLEHGAGVSTTVIAEKLGVSHATLFQRFKRKDDLLRAALLPSAEPPFFALLRRGPDARPLRQQLLALAVEISAFLEVMVPAIAVLRAAGGGAAACAVDADGTKGKEAPPLRARRLLTAYLKACAQRGLVRADADCGDAADIFLGALHFRPFQLHIAGRSVKADRAYLELIVDALVGAIAAKGAV